VSHAEWRKYNTNSRYTRSAPTFSDGSKRWSQNALRAEPSGTHNAQKNCEQYMALAQAEAQSGDRVAAENYYQHAEYHFRSMSLDPERK
jgi:hypothetical protein